MAKAIKVLESDGIHVKLRFDGYDQSYLNALRRISIAEVPVLAIDDVIILENTSPVYDEVVAHRLGLIPLVTPPDKYPLPEDCDCNSPSGCPKCRVMVVLDAAAAMVARTVYSGELVAPEDPEVRPVSDKIPLVKLGPNQRVKIESYARMGRGKEHAKWQSAPVAILSGVPEKAESYTLEVETEGNYTPTKLLQKSAEVLQRQVIQVSKGLGDS